MKVISFNVRQWSRDIKKSELGYWKKRARAIRDWLTIANPDLIFFQELTYPMTCCVPAGYKKATGCSVSHHIYCKEGYKVLNHEWHMRWCRALIETPQGTVNAFSIHTHWDEKIYRKTCTEITSKLEGGALNIAGGDWNNEPDAIRPLVQPMMLLRTGQNTFKNWETGKEAEIDFFAIWPYKASKCAAFPDFGYFSDHKPITAVTEP